MLSKLLSYMKTYFSFDVLYDVIATFGAAVSSSMICRALDNKRTLDKLAAELDGRPVPKEKKWYRFLRLLLIYMACILLSTSVYSFFRIVFTDGGSFGEEWISINLYLLRPRNVITLIAVPLLMQLIQIKGWVRTESCIIIAVVAFICMIAAPFLPNEKKSADIPEVKSVYTKKFYDIQNFRSNVKNGYRIATMPGIFEDDEENLIAPVKAVYEMSFDEAIEATRYYYKFGFHADAIDCLERAYMLFLNGLGSDAFHIGCMWWYKGNYESEIDYYLKAGEVFETDQEYENAGISYASAYRAGKETALEKALGNYYLAASAGKTDRAVDFLLEAYNDRGVAVQPYLESFSALLPDDLRTQMSLIVSHAPYFSDDDMETIERFQSLEQYSKCPKLAITKAFYDIDNVKELKNTGERLYSEFIENICFFDPEDRINTAWLFYNLGDYEKASKMIEGLSYPESALLWAAIYLHDDSGAVEQAQYVQYQLDYYTNEFSRDYDADSVLTYELVKAYLTKKVGVGTGPWYELSSGRYEDCIRLCDELLRSGGKTYEIMILKAEALIELSKEMNDASYMQEAENVLLEIRSMSEDSYIACLSKLKEVYVALPGRETELRDVDVILRAVS